MLNSSVISHLFTVWWQQDIYLMAADHELPCSFWHWLVSYILTCTHCGDGTLLANDVFLQPLLQWKAASLLCLTLPLLLLELWGERTGGSGVQGFHSIPPQGIKHRSGSPEVRMHSSGSWPLAVQSFPLPPCLTIYLNSGKLRWPLPGCPGSPC